MLKSFFVFAFSVFLFFSVLSFASGIEQPIKTDYSFTENKGQLHNNSNLPVNDILYYCNSGSMGIYISKDKLYYVFTKNKIENLFNGDKNEMPSETKSTENFQVEIKLIDGSKNCLVNAEQEIPLISNYYLPDFPNGISVHHYKKIKLQNIYTGVDWNFYFTEENGTPVFKYDFEVKSGADVSQIKLMCNGASKISKSINGGIEIETPFGKIQDGKPVSFLSLSKQPVKSSFKLSGNQISFEVTNGSSENLIIDPTVLWSTYFGYNGDEHGRAIAVGIDGSVYAGGFTNSTNFPGLNGYSSPIHAAYDSWIMKLSPSLQPIWITYYGGTSAEVCRCLEPDSAGNVFAGLETRSADIPTFNAYQSVKSDTDDFFIMKLDPQGIPIWASFYGGNNLDGMRRIKLSHSGYLVASGYSMSTNFPMINPIQSTNAGSADAVIMKVSMTTGFPIWTTYYGGSGYDEPVGITLDNNNNILLVGATESANFPVLNAYQSTLKGTSDIFVLKINQNLTTSWSTYIGSTDTDDGNGIAVDNAGSCFIVGSTTKGNYPKLNAWQTTIKLPADAVVSKFNATGGLVWSTLVGGVGTEDGQAIAVDNTGNALVTGYTLSTSYPLVNATQPVFGGARDAFILRFTNSGTCLMSTYYGGSDREQARAIAVDNNGSAYVIGSTGSTNLPLLNPFQSTNGSTGSNSGDCFMIKINYSLATKPVITVTGNNPKCNSSDFVTLTSSNATGNIWSNGSTTQSISVQQSGAYTVKSFDTTGVGISSDTIFIQNSILIGYVADSLAYLNLCQGSNFDLTAPVITGASYNWSGPNGFTSSAANPTVINLQNSSLGNYICTVTLGNCSGNVRKINLISFFNQLSPTNTNYSGPVCPGGQFTLQTDSFPGVQFNWSGPNGFTASSRIVTVSNVQSVNAGTYSVKWILNGCQSSISTVTVVIYETPVSDAGQDLLACNGNNSINLDATVPVIGTGIWTAFGLPHPVIVSPNDAHSLVTGLGATTYQFKWAVSYGNCTAVTDIAIVKYTTAANFGCIKPSNLYHTINGSSASLSWSNCTVADQFQVSYTINNVSHLVATTNYSVVLNNLSPGTYNWKVRPKCNGVWSSYSYIKSFVIVGPREEMIADDLKTEMQLYPNPVTDLLNVSFSISDAGNYKLEVYDLLGREIIAKENNYETGAWSEQLFTGQLSSGIYFVRLNGKDGMIETKKFVKQ